MENHWLSEAVFNNAAWCDAMAASHNISTQFDDSVWSCEHPMPPYYPNLITLRNGIQVEQIISALAPKLSSGWGVKDSFNELELEGQGFKIAFEASWYCCLPKQIVATENSQIVQVKRVRNQTELNRWVDAWGDGCGIFNSSLLENSFIELLYVEIEDEIVCGLATNQCDSSVGISNLFGEKDTLLGCIKDLINRFPLKGIVGYGDKDEATRLLKIGFEEIGDLRVWLRH